MSAEKRLVWIDCDPGHDDAIAIFLAGTHPKLQLIGLSSVFGNTSVENTARNGIGCLQMAGITNVPVYKGASQPMIRFFDVQTADFHGKTGFDGCTLPQTDVKAIDKDVYYQIFNKIKSYLPKKVTFIATGALTNLAILLKSFPDFNQYVDMISIMGGAIGQGNINPNAEYNIWTDPESAAIVFESGIKTFLAPLELTYQVSIDKPLIEKIQKDFPNTKFIANVVSFMTHYLKAYKNFCDIDFAPLHDPVAVYYLVEPEAITTQFVNVVVECKSQYCDGRTIIDVNKLSQRKPNVHVGIKIEQKKFWDCILSTIDICNKQSPINHN